MPDRRYTDDEVAEIFRRATESPSTGVPTPHTDRGLTLGDLQEIGREVGLSPAAIDDAARSLETGPPPAATDQRLFGLPIAVGHVVELDRQLSDKEWDQLVVAARDTFAARGQMRAEGAFRQWTNGNLQVLLEPGERGSRVRFRTLNGHARRMMIGGLALAGIGALLAALAVMDTNADRLETAAILLVIGAAMGGRGVWGLRRWASRRQAQFRELANRVKGEGEG